MSTFPKLPVIALFGCALACSLIAGVAGARAKGKETVLYGFCPQHSCVNGANPLAGLLEDKKGDLFGTASSGGARGGGVVFELKKSGVETPLYNFCSQDSCSDGGGPIGDIIADSAGNLFGTTQNGGPYNFGTVFKLAPDGTETVLHAFCGTQCSGGVPDGVFPGAGLLEDSEGNLYGTAPQGGSSDYGIVFRIAPDGTETILHNFTRGNDGGMPDCRLIADKKGNLYGTTIDGGSVDQGVIFKLSPGGAESTLYAFQGGSDATYSVAGLIEDKKGNFYGTSELGGTSDSGAVFKLTRDGRESVLYSFTGGPDGGYPLASLVEDSKGNLYSTTEVGGGTGCGGGGCGTVFRLSSKGKETVLYAFQGGVDGASPRADLIADSSGNLYGTADQDGAGGGGVVFRVKE